MEGRELYCRDCERYFFSEYNYKRHLQSRAHAQLREEGGEGSVRRRGKWSCTQCPAAFARKDNLLRHATAAHPPNNISFRCGLCQDCFSKQEDLERHRRENHVERHDFYLEESAHKKQCQLLRAQIPTAIHTLDEGLIYAFDHMRGLVSSLSTKLSFYKINFTMFVEMYRLGETGEMMQSEVFPFRSHGIRVHREKEMGEELAKACGDVERNVREFLFQGSGWIVKRPMFMEAEVVQCYPLAGKSCRLHVATFVRNQGIVPTALSEANDGMCFYYAVAAHFLPEKLTTSEETLKQYVLKNFKQVREKAERGVTLRDVDVFEELNSELDMAINIIYQDEEKSIIPVRASKRLGKKNNICLLLFDNKVRDSEGRERDVMHYALVRQPEKLFAKRVYNEEGKVTHTDDVWICWNCHNTMRRKVTYDNHVAFCHTNNCQRIELPEEGEKLFFEWRNKSNAKVFKSAFMLAFDFEALQVEPDKTCSCSPKVIANTHWWESSSQEDRENFALEHHMLEGEYSLQCEVKQREAEERRKKQKKGGEKREEKLPPYPLRLNLPKLCDHKTKVVKNQPPFAYSCVLFDRDGKVREEDVYVGEDAAENFVLRVIHFSKKYLPQLTPGTPMNELTVEERDMILGTHYCYLCGREMEQRDRVLDHDHLNGNFLGVAHNSCNLRRRERYTLTCFAHNFSGYDSHFIIKALNKYSHHFEEINAIPLNTQKFKSITLDKKIKFVDSCQFLLDSLSNLVNTQRKGGNTFDLLNQVVSDPEKKDLLLRKGVYPYSFATSEEILRQTKSLPPREAFYSDLKMEECSREDYAHAQKVWKTFNCRNMLDYTVLYVRTDTLLLAEVVLAFRNSIWSCFHLDMCQYLSLPHLAKDIMLKETGAEIDLIADQEMSDLLQKNIRGGLSYVNLRHAERVGEGEKEERRSLLYLDANNLYGKSMCFPMPLRGFRWMTREELDSLDIEKDVSEEDGRGYILEVDLEYPEELHLSHNSYPLACESVDVKYNMLSPYSRRCLSVLRGEEYREWREDEEEEEEKEGVRKKYKSTKLSATFRNRTAYLTHGLNLKFYLKMGLKLTRIRRGITFHQEKFIKPFIEKCTKKRMTAPTLTEQTMWKLICNSVYGKVREKSAALDRWTAVA